MLLCAAGEGDVASDYGSVVRPQVPQYVTLQILAILQPYPQERDVKDLCLDSDVGESRDLHKLTNINDQKSTFLH